jgi:hypothetical protein
VQRREPRARTHAARAGAEARASQVRILLLPAGAVLPPLQHPTGSLVLCKALFGAADVRQMLGDPRGPSFREAVRVRVEPSSLTSYMGGPCRIYGEASMAEPVALLEVSLMPLLKITSMEGFVDDPADKSLVANRQARARWGPRGAAPRAAR